MTLINRNRVLQAWHHLTDDRIGFLPRTLAPNSMNQRHGDPGGSASHHLRRAGT
jgi:hypothetical protein